MAGRKSRAKTMIGKIQEDGVTTKVVPFAEDLRPATGGHMGAAVLGAHAAAAQELRDKKDIRDARDPRDEPEQSLARLSAGGERIMLPVERLVANPDQYCAVDRGSESYARTKASIAAIGIAEDLLVRDATSTGLYEILSGHTRKEIAIDLGIAYVPCKVIRGLTDAQAFDLLASANIRKPLSPFEWGRMVATWLDKYGQDAKAVASKLGKTVNWVLTHAAIHNRLIEGWKQEAAHEPGSRYDKRNYAHWTAEHWTHIARLPAAIQERWLDKIRKDYRFDPHDATAETVAGWLKTETLYLKDAAFPSLDMKEEVGWCHDCAKRTDADNLLLFADPGIEPDKAELARCLDPKCWAKKEGRAIKEAFATTRDAAIERHGITGDKARAAVVPVCLASQPEHYDPTRQARYKETVKPLRKAFGSGLVTADRVEIVKEGTKGAILGIVVAGDKKTRKGAEVWVKVKTREKRDAGGCGHRETPESQAAREAKEALRLRWQKVVRVIFKEMAGAKRLADTAVLLASLHCATWPALDRYGSRKQQKRIQDGEAAMATAHEAGDAAMAMRALAEWCWEELVRTFTEKAAYAWGSEDERKTLAAVASLFGIDVNQRYNAMWPPEGAKAKAGKDAKDLKDVRDEKGGTCPVASGEGECAGDGNCKVCPRGAGKKKRSRKAAVVVDDLDEMDPDAGDQHNA